MKKPPMRWNKKNDSAGPTRAAATEAPLFGPAKDTEQTATSNNHREQQIQQIQQVEADDRDDIAEMLPQKN
jgi:hypothetical protein